MLRKIAIAILITLIFAGQINSIYGQTQTDREVISRLLDEFLDGAGRNDRLIHDRFWAADLIYTSSTGRRFGKAELMKGVIESPPAKPTDPKTVFTAEDVDIRIYDGIAVVAFRLVSVTTNADGTIARRNNLNTGTFAKRENRWQVIAWQSTIVPDPNTQTAGATPTPDKRRTVNRKYMRGSKGGCYYLNSKRKRIYVDRTMCNAR